MASLTATITQACQQGAGVLTLSQADPAPGAGPNLSYQWSVQDAFGTEYGTPFYETGLPLQVTGLSNASYRSYVTATDQDSGAVYTSRTFSFDIQCAPATGGGTGGGTGPVDFHLDSYAHTDESAAGAHDGTGTVQATGGVAPLTASVPELSLSQAATSGQPTTFPGLPAGRYTLRVTDSSSPTPQMVQAQVEVLAYAAPVSGCQDEYADNYDPTATSGGMATCTYSPRWRSAWQPMAVRVPAVAGQTLAYVAARLLVGFRPGHPLAAQRPYGAAIAVRATVGPDGYATFRLGPLLRPLLGAPDGLGGYRLDFNSPTATTSDLYVGYELRRADDDSLLEHGYALNSAVPDSWLAGGQVLAPFAGKLPVWPGFDDYAVARLDSLSSGRYGEVDEQAAYQTPAIHLACPSNPLPVAWLAPGGGYGYWVFQGKTQLGDTVADGQTYSEHDTGQRRYSERGESRRSYQASSGAFKGPDLAEGLATLWRSPQVWVQPVVGGEWVPVTIESGAFPVRRIGVGRNEVNVTFSEAAAQYAQGQ